jgi:DNA-binding response OmpR family regulator
MKRKILIVDDEPINLDFFDVMLSRLGFQVEMAEDGEEALDLIQEDKPDLIILDNIMPKMTGWEFTRLLKRSKAYERYSDIPIIMFSAMDAIKDKIEGFELGIEDYITKPFNFSEVLARIRAVLRNKELARKVLNREKRLNVIEGMIKSYNFFAQHLKEPMLNLLQTAKNLDANNPEQMAHFKSKVIEESEKVLSALQSLEEEVKQQRESEPSANDDNDLEELEEKFQRHFQSWNQNT